VPIVVMAEQWPCDVFSSRSLLVFACRVIECQSPMAFLKLQTIDEPETPHKCKMERLAEARSIGRGATVRGTNCRGGN